MLSVFQGNPMTKITYYDREKAAPRVVFHGVEFEHKDPVEVDEIKQARLIRLADANPFFEVTEKGDSEPNKAYGRGVDAAGAGKERSVPPAYRGKADANHWLAGFDDKARELEEIEAAKKAAELNEKSAA
jgi:hypothetical protein